MTPTQVRSWYAHLLATRPGAAATAYRLLRAIFNTAVRDELLVRSPCRVPRAGTDRAVERPMLTVAEVDALQAAMPPQLRVAVTLAAWGGLRRGEVLALRRKDVDPLRSSTRIEERRGGVPMRPKTLVAAFSRARASCELPHVRFHDLRHFALTMAETTCATTKEIMRRAGHSSPAAALRYQHATEDRDRAIAEALGKLARGDVVALSDAKRRNASRPQRARRLRGGESHPLCPGKSSGGETRTLNLAVNSRLLCH